MPDHKGAKVIFSLRLALFAGIVIAMVDPVQCVDTGASYRQSRREMYWMIGTWIIFFAWVIGYSSVTGYSSAEKAEVEMVYGIPRWVFFGWVVPLLVANGFTVWFCLYKMQDEPMEEMPEDTP